MDHVSIIAPVQVRGEQKTDAVNTLKVLKSNARKIWLRGLSFVSSRVGNNADT
jgi:hypothetical protein